MKLVGYSDRLSVQPGQNIRFMVSSESPTYRAEIVRVIYGDANPKGSHVKHEPVETPVSGEYRGRRQEFPRGSYAIVRGSAKSGSESGGFDCAEGFTLQAWICPTTPGRGVQGILTHGSEAEGVGYGLFIDEDGGLALWLGNGAGKVEKVRVGKALTASQWYFVAGTYDARTGKVGLYQEPVTSWPRNATVAVVEATVERGLTGSAPAGLTDFLMAAYWKKAGGDPTHVAGHYNGKIDSPRVFGRALDSTAVELLKGGSSPGEVGEALLAAWDFSRDISGQKVTDTSARGLHGHTVNTPARAVGGYNWTGNEVDFRAAPGEYGAIHFHDDDLDDARWDVAFELTVPKGLRSGVYAARLSIPESEDDGQGPVEDYLPFFVRPPKGTTTADIAFLVPTLSYLVYADQKFNNPDRMELRGLEPGSARPQDQYIVDEQLYSLYDFHSDGSGVWYGSRLRPLVNIRPGYCLPPLSMGAGSPSLFSADLHFIEWLEEKSYSYDVITDEDLHEEGVGLLAPYRVILTGNHPEYFTRQMLDGVDGYLAGGGRLMYLGGNGFYWVTSFDPERPHIFEVRRWGGSRSCPAEPGQFYHSTTGEMGGLWRFRNRPPQKTVGVGFTSMGKEVNRPYRRQPDSFDPRAAFIFEGVGADELIGDFECRVLKHGAAGFEVDRYDLDLGTPPHTLLLASATDFPDGYQIGLEDLLDVSGPVASSKNPLIRADMVYLEGPHGGGVFSVGSISWGGGLAHQGFDNNVSRITDNVLRRFASEEPLA
jgi:N,N-dimethylformamidase